MLFEAFHLAARLSALGSIHQSDVAGLVSDVQEVAIIEEPLFDGDDYTARLRTAKLLVVWSIRESAGKANALGDCDDSAHRTTATCRSVGAMQINKLWLPAFAVSAESLLADRKLSLRIGLSLMRQLRDKCGSVSRGLNAYASGKCSGNASSKSKVAYRCAVAGC